jgi:cAMP-dependent protein kinase regulator
LSTLESDQKATIIRALEGPVTKAEGETIITQGDPGDCFYLLQDGTVEVSVRRGRGSEESLTHTYSSGSTFGELSLLYNAPRAATCRAKSPCVLWTLDRLSFRVTHSLTLSMPLFPHLCQVLVVSSTLRKRERYMSFLRQVPILETLSEMELLAVADALVPEEHRDEAIICEEGQVGEKFYLIEVPLSFLPPP